ncbi:unnamed protein product [Pleuronectes platessa]|uniref:Uncharacterized protein n=1 Tax=Pleuronectes platessa TaxID=8262 RepID=A0A9N7TQI2_PLEPL|nr:unnamed protein product [Pleuronectes platessa]
MADENYDYDALRDPRPQESSQAHGKVNGGDDPSSHQCQKRKDEINKDQEEWFYPKEDRGGGANDPKTRTRQMNESFNFRPCVWINDRVHLPGTSLWVHESSADVSATQGELISPVTTVRAAHGKIARHLHTAARPPRHERESMELLIRTLPAHPAGPPHPRTQSLNCC